MLNGNFVSWYDCTVNSMGRRSNVQEQGTAYPGNAAVDWGYNARGEVTLHNHSANTNDRVFAFDGIGNRTKGAVGTVLPVGADTVSNALNQYTAFTGFNLGYDFDGNLTTDGGANSSGTPRTYQWDGQNQLRQVSLTTGGAVLASFRYDPYGRRLSKTGSGVTTWYVYDGWNLIAEYQSGTLQRKHVWGTDLSGSAQGAGGVGGLLCTHIGSSRYYPLYDGNGNICQYLDAAGAIAAKYEYGPFGHLHSAGGPASSSLRFRFSTKYADPETGDYYYGYRYYSSWIGRWINRDPIGERGGVNLYGILRNNAINKVDVLGNAEGTFTVTREGGITNRDGVMPTPPGDIGFRVRYETASTCSCPDPPNSIKLVQAIGESAMVFSDDPDFDATTDQKKRRAAGRHGFPRYPGYESYNPPAGTYDITDAPLDPGKTTIWYLEVCAVCVAPGGRESILGCIRFNFNNDTRAVDSVPPKTPAHNPSDLWKAAEKNW